LNKSEQRHALAQTVFTLKQGGVADRSHDAQQFRATGLNLVIAAIVRWNSIYISDAVAHLRARGQPVTDELLAHTSPLTGERIGFSGDFPGAVPPPPQDSADGLARAAAESPHDRCSSRAAALRAARRMHSGGRRRPSGGGTSCVPGAHAAALLTDAGFVLAPELDLGLGMHAGPARIAVS
jgi:hypothetical protein